MTKPRSQSLIAKSRLLDRLSYELITKSPNLVAKSGQYLGMEGGVTNFSYELGVDLKTLVFGTIWS